MSKPEPSITVYLNDDGSAKLFNPSDLTLDRGPNLFYSAAALEAVRRAALEEVARLFDGEVWSYDYREIAARIRALIDREASDENPE